MEKLFKNYDAIFTLFEYLPLKDRVSMLIVINSFTNKYKEFYSGEDKIYKKLIVKADLNFDYLKIIKFVHLTIKFSENQFLDLINRHEIFNILNLWRKNFCIIEIEGYLFRDYQNFNFISPHSQRICIDLCKKYSFRLLNIVERKSFDYVSGTGYDYIENLNSFFDNQKVIVRLNYHTLFFEVK